MAFTLLMSWIPIVVLLVNYDADSLWSDVMKILPAFAIAGGFILALRIRCSHCGAILATRFPYKGGGAILLWAVPAHCPECDVRLGWK